jgi:hypothetical protein
MNAAITSEIPRVHGGQSPRPLISLPFPFGHVTREKGVPCGLS